MVSQSNVFEILQVSVEFQDHRVLEQINFQVKKGESVVLIGPSGHGKTVLLKTLAGLINPSKGGVLIEGHNWRDLRGAKRAEILKQVGMLFQKNALFDSLTCGENIAFPLREVTGFSESEIQDRVRLFLEAVGIPEARELYPEEISGGMQKRLGIARALSLEPEIILYDDPTAGLDPITSRRIIELILKLKKEKNSTVVAITNDINRACQMADRIIMVVDREIVDTGDPAQIKNHSDPRVRQFVRGDLSGPLTVVG